MVSKRDKNKQRLKRHARVRVKINGTASCPRLSVFRSSKHIYAQIIDDTAKKTLAAASTVEKDFDGATGNADAAAKVGKLIAERAIKAGIENVVFDRGGYLYHGRIQALADAAREAGLKF